MRPEGLRGSGRDTQLLGLGQGAGAHLKHLAHVRDARRVEVQRLVERRRSLPRVQREKCGAGRLVWSGMPACTGRLDWSLSKGRTGGVFTLNICPIFLTLDVSKFSGWLKLSASCQVERRAHIRCGAGCEPGGGEVAVRRRPCMQRAEFK